jgi:non-ribosomal peptide synthetase-like protein
MLPIVGAIFILVLTLESVIFKWILVGKVKPGKYPVHGSFYIRNWIIEHLLKLSLNYAGQLHATLHVAHWYRALGMKIGKSVELSTAITGAPDLVNLSNESTIADEVSLGTPHVERGWMTLANVKLGQRAFVGNSGVVPSGRVMGDGSLVGVLSIAPNAQEARQPNATWFGSPSILFPKREINQSFTEEKTYRPSRWMRFKRGAFELLRVTLPPTGFILVTIAMIHFALVSWESLGLGTTLAILPIIYAAASIGVVLITALIKWLVVGRYKPFVKPLWSNFVWRLEFVNALYEFLSAPLLLQSLQGTPFLAWYLRLLGARIGDMCYIDTTGFLEWDLIEIGDRTAIGEDAVMQTHLFEDRILKASNFRIGDDCSVGASSVVLYNTTMHSGSQLDSLSLLMKGEVLPPRTEWRGIPALSKESEETGNQKEESLIHKLSA